MDLRARFAQSLTLLASKRRAAPAPRPRPYAPLDTNSRALAALHRWGHALIALNVPRGAGASAAALLLLGSAWYGVVKGGHVEDVADAVQDICDAAANTVGFRISEIALAGQHEVSREDILNLAGVTGRSSLLFLDAARTRARLMSNPWIAQAAVLKLYPDRLRIEIKERKAYALWQKDGRVHVIAADGTVLQDFVSGRYTRLPLLVGEGAEHEAAVILDLLKRYPEIAKSVEASVRVADRRWTLHLTNGIDVLLPEHDPARALQHLVDLDRDKKLLSRDIVKIDLRLADRVTVQQSDAAAAARDAALNAAEKAKKKKGNEA